MIKLETCVVKQSWVNMEYRRGLSMLRISVVEILLATLTTWGRPVHDPVAQGGVQTPDYSSALRLVVSLKSTRVLKAEL
jgi:hypothetical protein